MRVMIDVIPTTNGFYINGEIIHDGKTCIIERFTVEKGTVYGKNHFDRLADIAAGIVMRSTDIFRATYPGERRIIRVESGADRREAGRQG